MPSSPRAVMAARGEDARERVLYTAYALFAREGIHAVGVDRIVAEAGVAKMTLYRHFHSKEALLEAVLDLREELFTFGWLTAEIERRARTPRTRLLAIFDAFDEWFQRDDFEACLFINTLVESHDGASANGASAAAAKHLGNIRAMLVGLADEGGVRDPEEFALVWQTLMSGSIVQAAQGSRDAARVAREVGRLVIADR